MLMQVDEIMQRAGQRDFANQVLSALQLSDPSDMTDRFNTEFSDIKFSRPKLGLAPSSARASATHSQAGAGGGMYGVGVGGGGSHDMVIGGMMTTTVFIAALLVHQCFANTGAAKRAGYDLVANEKRNR
jgi:hypothetical protein